MSLNTERTDTLIKNYTWSEYVQRAQDLYELEHSYMLDRRMDWCANLTGKQVLDLMHNGDESIVPQAEKIIEQLEVTSEGIEIPAWQGTPMGAYPCVPEYLAGSPTPMRLLAPSNERSPVTIYCGMTPQESVTEKQMVKRGAVLLALVLKLQQIRPVELNWFMTTGHRGTLIEIVRLDSKPISVAHAAFALSNVGLLRRVGFGSSIELNFSSHGSVGFGAMSRDEAAQRKQLNVLPEDIFIPSNVLSNSPMFNDSLKWINEQIQRYNRIED